MTAKEKVLTNYPSAKARVYTDDSDKPRWGIFMAGATKPFASGKTSFSAWVNAKHKITYRPF